MWSHRWLKQCCERHFYPGFCQPGCIIEYPYIFKLYYMISCIISALYRFIFCSYVIPLYTIVYPFSLYTSYSLYTWVILYHSYLYNIFSPYNTILRCIIHFFMFVLYPLLYNTRAFVFLTVLISVASYQLFFMTLSYTILQPW